jgi:hypothetical protein
MRRIPGIRARHVNVEDGTEEKLVPHGAAHDPRVLAAQDLAHALIHRR